MSLYKIEQGKIDALDKALEDVEDEQRKRIFTALDGIFGELEGDAFIVKQYAGIPMFSDRTKEHAIVVAERIYNFIEYLQTK